VIAVLSVTLPVFLLIGAGALAVRAGAFTPPQVEGLMIFTQRFAIPCLLFRGVAELDLAAGFDARLLSAYYTGSALCFAAGIAGARLWLRRGWEDAVAIGFAAMFANSVLLGLPITERAYGPDVLTFNFGIVAVHAAFCYLLGTAAMEVARAGGRGLPAGVATVARSLATNALMIGVALGLAVNLSGLALPGFLADPIRLMATAALPAALFGLGGVLVQYRVAGDGRGIALVCGISLLVHPSWAWAAGQILGLPRDALRAAVITAAMAPGVNSYLFAAMTGHATRISAASVLLGTAASVLTIPAWLWLLG
jgi:predicted permease